MYPAVYMIKANCATGASTTAAHRIGHACADVVAMAFVLCLIWAIANAKSLAADAKGFDVAWALEVWAQCSFLKMYH